MCYSLEYDLTSVQNTSYMESIVSSRCAIHFNYRAYEALEEHMGRANYSKVFILVDENTNKECLPHFSAQLEETIDSMYEVF